MIMILTLDIRMGTSGKSIDVDQKLYSNSRINHWYFHILEL